MHTSTNKNNNDSAAKPSSKPVWVNERSIAKGFGETVDKLIQMDGMTFPQDEALERRVVADLMAEGELDGRSDLLMRKLIPFLRHEDFYYLKYAMIYAAMVRIHLRGDKLDVQAVVSELKNRDPQILDNLGGERFLTGLSIGIPSNTETHARNVARLALFRATILAGYKLRSLGQRTHLEMRELSDDINKVTRDIQARVSVMDERNVYDMGVYQKQYLMQIIEEAQNPDFVPGIPIWIDKLHSHLYGWLPNNLYVLAAGTGMGKSQMLINAALDVAGRGKKVVLITLELTIEKIFDRIVSALTGISGRNIKERKLKPSDIDKLHALADNPNNPLTNLTIVVMNTPTMKEIHAKLDELYYRIGFEFVCIDYLGIETVRHDGDKYPGQTEHSSQMWQDMRGIKGEYGVPFLVATQVNRKYMQREDKRPLLTDISNSSICEKASDVVMLFHRLSVIDKMGKINHGDIEIAKNRDATNGQVVDVWFDEANGQIKNWPDVEDVETAL